MYECIPAHYYKITYILGDFPTCLGTRSVAERGANVCPGNVVEKHENVNPGAPLLEGYAPGTATEGLAQVR